MRLTLLVAVVLALILVPFILFEHQINGWIAVRLANGSARTVVAGIITTLLAADIVLPVPSSLLSTAAGALLGFIPGLAASFTGMTAGCLLGYVVGRRAPSERWLTPADLDRVRRARERWGDWALVVSRAVPVLAEASVLFAGLSGVPLRRFLVLTGLSNLGISAIYAAAGAYSSSRDTFLLAFAAAIAVPGLAMLIARRQ